MDVVMGSSDSTNQGAHVAHSDACKVK